MYIDSIKFKNKLIESGMHKTTANSLATQIKKNEYRVNDLLSGKYKFFLEKGFLPDIVDLCNINESNYSDFLSDLDYAMVHPLNNHFKIWIDDKLTLKYILNNEKFKDLMPKYYIYIENDGKYTYLMDWPNDIPYNENSLDLLLRKNKVLALKPNRGSGGRGFIKLQLIDNNIFVNNVLISDKEYLDIKNNLNGYIVTEYVEQNKELDKIWPDSVCSLRIIMYKNVQKNIYDKAKYDCLISYARFGTSKTGGASNLSQGGIGVPFDFETGYFHGFGLKYMRFNSGEHNDSMDRHPDTNFVFKGYKLPNIEKIKQSLTDICNYISSVDYLGFDVFITNEGIKICEINSLPATNYEQKMFKEVLKNESVKSFFDSKKKKIYPEDLLWQIFNKCIEN